MNERMSQDIPMDVEPLVLPKIDVKVFPTQGDGKLLAKASVTLGDCFTINQIKIYDTEKGLFVAMPSERGRGGFRDICHPATREMREALNAAVIDQYQQTVEHISSRSAEVAQKASVRGALQEAKAEAARFAQSTGREQRMTRDVR